MECLSNTYRRLQYRELHDAGHFGFQRSCQVTPEFIQRIGLEAELEGHNGCVNCLEWNKSGTMLASGSDDVQVLLWKPHLRKPITTIPTSHEGNIFSVKFLPDSNDNIIVTAAADCKVKVHDVEAGEIRHIFGCHNGRVKRLATAPTEPCMFWSAAEDGTIMQFDLRDANKSNSNHPQNVLVNLNAHVGQHAEAKCIAINPLRPEQLAVGANDAFVRIYDRRKLQCRGIQFPSQSIPLSNPDSTDGWTSPKNFHIEHPHAKYYVAGHLPQQQSNKRKLLASTFLTFSPNGSELLVNLGGEQIYIFDVNRTRTAQRYNIPPAAHANGIVKDISHSNGINIASNGITTNGVSKHIAQTQKQHHRPHINTTILPPMADMLKQKANKLFESDKYNQAILLYNQAINVSPNASILYGNRAAAFMKRKWDGDLYAALRDCHMATSLDNEYVKGYFRLARCLYELEWITEAQQSLQNFMQRFPNYSRNKSCKELETLIKKASLNKTMKEDHVNPNTDMSEMEQQWRAEALDYSHRFCGHCNTTTDIKEANFFGSNGQYIAAGSDDGSFFIWERSTCNIVRVLRGDESIVNCIQPHPTNCLLATSGIESCIRLWSPRPQDGKDNDREIANSDDAASANQRRMNADPLAVMLLNMGYRYNVLQGEESDGDEENTPTCRTS